MIFAKVDVSIYSHPKFVTADFEASGYWLHALAYLRHHESEDGFLSSLVIHVPLSTRPRKARRLCERLVSAGLFAKVDGGYLLLQYADKNQTRADIEARRMAAKERKARSRTRAGPPLPDSPNPERGTEVVARDVDVVTRDMPERVTRSVEEVSHAPSLSLSSSLSLSLSSEERECRGGGAGADSPPGAGGDGGDAGHGAGPPARRPLPTSERSLSGPAWMAAFSEGIARKTGRPCSVGRMYLSTLERVVGEHAPQRDAPSACTWLREQAAAFAAQWDGQHPPKGLTPDGLERWLNDGRVGPPQFGRGRVVQSAEDPFDPDDFKDMDVEIITRDGVVVHRKSKGASE